MRFKIQWTVSMFMQIFELIYQKKIIPTHLLTLYPLQNNYYYVIITCNNVNLHCFVYLFPLECMHPESERLSSIKL